MVDFGIFEEYRRMKDHDVILSFKGMLSQNILVGLVEIIKEKLLLKPGMDGTARKIYSILIELAQNVIHHSAERIVVEDENLYLGRGIVLLSESDDCYTVTTGNPARNEKLTNFKTLLDTINFIEKEDAQKLYKSLLRSPMEKGKRGSGAALLNFVRKPGNSITYDVNAIDRTHSFLIISARIDKEGES